MYRNSIHRIIKTIGRTQYELSGKNTSRQAPLYQQSSSNEMKRLTELSEKTINKYSHLAEEHVYLQLISEFDSICNDGLITSVLQNTQLHDKL